MKHYLTKLIETPIYEDPVNEVPDVHKHFTRYSRGHFDGPALKLSKTKATITISGSYEYEDEITRIALEQTEDESFSVTGVVMGGVNFTKLMDKLGFDPIWHPKKSTGKTAKYETQMKTAVTVDRKCLDQLSIKGVPYVYSFINFTSSDGKIILKTKKKAPRPSNKNPENAKLDSKIKFCVLKMPNTPERLEMLLERIFPDFVDEVPVKWKTITIQNSYNIADLIIPSADSVKNSRLIRLHTVRTGDLQRILNIDKEPYTSHLEIRV